MITELVSGLIQNGMLPQRAYHLSMTFAVWALAASAVLAWFHGAKGTQETTTREKVILAVLGVGWIATTVWVLLR